MKTKVFLKTVALSAVILFSAMAASAANKKQPYLQFGRERRNDGWANRLQDGQWNFSKLHEVQLQV